MTTSGHIPAPAVSTAMPIAGMPPGAGMLTPSVIPLSTIQQFWVSNYRLTEGDMSRFMLAPTAFAQVPPQFRPGKTIDVVGLKLSSGEIQKIWRPDQIPENISQIVGGDEGEYVFWLHPLAFSASTLPSELEGLLIFRRMQRVNEQTSKKLSKLMRENPKITGKAVVSSSVRSVLLFEIDGKRVDAPQELKLHLPVFINQSSRAFEAGEIGYAWDIHGKYPETSAQTLFASSMAGIVQLDAIFDEMGTRPSTT